MPRRSLKWLSEPAFVHSRDSRERSATETPAFTPANEIRAFDAIKRNVPPLIVKRWLGVSSSSKNASRKERAGEQFREQCRNVVGLIP